MKPTVEVEEIVKHFPAGKRQVGVINGVSFVIEPGEFVILYGPSGSGKSTLLHLIAGLERPSSGEIKIRGRYLSHMDDDQLARVHRTKIGMVFQQFNLIPTLSALDNVALPQIFIGEPLNKRKERALKMMKLMEIDKFTEQAPTELSGGEQQRLAIARALVNDPWLLLIDEPTGNLDTKTAQDVVNVIVELNREAQRTILLVTHNPDYLHIAHRVLYLQDGKVVKQQRIRPFKASTSKSDHKFVRLREG